MPQSWLRQQFQRLSESKGLWIRIVVCWIFGVSLPFFDEVQSYDLRFQVRNTQTIDKKIILVYFDQDEWATWLGPAAGRNLIRSLKEFSTVSDSFYWNPQAWNTLLGNILTQEPESIGVTLFFNESLTPPAEHLTYIKDERVTWAGQLDNDSRASLPITANSYGLNVALVDVREDEDRVLRRYAPTLTPLPHMGVILADGSDRGRPLKDSTRFFGEPKMINFRGSRDVFPSVSAISIIHDQIPPGFFKDKIVIIGSRSLESQIYQTPVGRMTPSDVIAQIVDNALNERWIKRSQIWVYAIYLLAILLLTTLILTSYPQSVAIIFLLWLTLGTTALSIWAFDSYYIWAPAFSPAVLIMISYMVLIGYQLTLKENLTWRLEQETALLSELDQLRNNFVSLISHDLKTPIAKIQAICDRLLSKPVEEEVKDGLISLRKESVELHRYIQSILQISRLEASQSQVRREAADINELVEKVVAQVQSIATDKRQTLNVKLEPMFSLEIDAVMIQEVILNLIENAIKYTPNDGIIEIETNEIDDKVIFAVKDNGPGIPEGDRGRIFEKFFRGRAEQSTIKGTGLGLFLVKYFIELHGGEVFLESSTGQGTRAGFSLPLKE